MAKLALEPQAISWATKQMSKRCQCAWLRQAWLYSISAGMMCELRLRAAQ